MAAKAKVNFQSQPPPSNYFCFKCKLTGDHWVQNCPQKQSKTYNELVLLSKECGFSFTFDSHVYDQFVHPKLQSLIDGFIREEQKQFVDNFYIPKSIGQMFIFFCASQPIQEPCGIVDTDKISQNLSKWIEGCHSTHGNIQSLSIYAIHRLLHKYSETSTSFVRKYDEIFNKLAKSGVACQILRLMKSEIQNPDMHLMLKCSQIINHITSVWCHKFAQVPSILITELFPFISDNSGAIIDILASTQSLFIKNQLLDILSEKYCTGYHILNSGRIFDYFTSIWHINHSGYEECEVSLSQMTDSVYCNTQPEYIQYLLSACYLLEMIIDTNATSADDHLIQTIMEHISDISEWILFILDWLSKHSLPLCAEYDRELWMIYEYSVKATGVLLDLSDLYTPSDLDSDEYPLVDKYRTIFNESGLLQVFNALLKQDHLDETQIELGLMVKQFGVCTPSNYTCFKCNLIGDHWIQNCAENTEFYSQLKARGYSNKYPFLFKNITK